jgi:hypothetical protein
MPTKKSTSRTLKHKPSKKPHSTRQNTSKSKQSDKIREFKYFAKSSYYSPGFINELITRYMPKNTKIIPVPEQQLKEYIQTNKPLDFIYLDGKYLTDPVINSVRARLKNIVSEEKRQITLKDRLMVNLRRIPAARKYTLNQLEIDLSDKNYLEKIRGWYKPGQVYIFKDINSYAGKGILVVKSYDELITYIQKIIPKYKPLWRNTLKDRFRMWVLQEYITNPLLYDGYKFHIRWYLFYLPGGKSFNLSRGEIATAKQPYQKVDWANTDIHDTHFQDRDGDIFPGILKLPPGILTKIYSQIDDISNLALQIPRAKCYPESERCYELFGMDLMITDEYHVKILEINEKIGMPSERSPIVQDIFAGICQVINQSNQNGKSF